MQARAVTNICVLTFSVLFCTRIALAQQIPTWMGSSQGVSFTMVGTNPAQGSVKTKVPVALIPIKIKYPDGTILNPNVTACGGTDTPVNLTLNSPLFQTTDFAPGGTDLGITQYTDAFQRANFWTTVSQVSPDYHVLLKAPFVEPVQTIRLTDTSQGQIIQPVGACPTGVISQTLFDQTAQGLLTTLGIPASTLAVFLTYDTIFSTPSGGSEGGYHSLAFGNQTYVVASFTDPGAFSSGDDVAVLSHELAEWMDDPFINNTVPGWSAGGSCHFLLEVGDPLAGVTFPVFLNGFTYHLQDLAFLSWFTREVPSSAVNQWYSFQNNLQSVSSCP